MVIYHPKHSYLTKEQFLKEFWIFPFFENLGLSVPFGTFGFLDILFLFGFTRISQVHDGINQISLFIFSFVSFSCLFLVTRLF